MRPLLQAPSPVATAPLLPLSVALLLALPPSWAGSRLGLFSSSAALRQVLPNGLRRWNYISAVAPHVCPACGKIPMQSAQLAPAWARQLCLRPARRTKHALRQAIATPAPAYRMVRWPSGVTRHRQVAVGAPLSLCSSSGRTPCAAMLSRYSAPTASLPTMPTKATFRAAPGGLQPAAVAAAAAGPVAALAGAADAVLPCARHARPFITLAALPPGTLQQQGEAGGSRATAAANMATGGNCKQGSIASPTLRRCSSLPHHVRSDLGQGQQAAHLLS